MNNNFDCGARIRELRVGIGLSQEELALLSEITPSYLGMIERGEKNPTVRIIEKICHSLNISLSEFFADIKKETSAFSLAEEKIKLLLHFFDEEQKEQLHEVLNAIVKIKSTEKTK